MEGVFIYLLSDLFTVSQQSMSALEISKLLFSKQCYIRFVFTLNEHNECAYLSLFSAPRDEAACLALNI